MGILKHETKLSEWNSVALKGWNWNRFSSYTHACSTNKQRGANRSKLTLRTELPVISTHHSTRCLEGCLYLRSIHSLVIMLYYGLTRVAGSLEISSLVTFRNVLDSIAGLGTRVTAHVVTAFLVLLTPVHLVHECIKRPHAKRDGQSACALT
jgi:hypothetical protein